MKPTRTAYPLTVVWFLVTALATLAACAVSFLTFPLLSDASVLAQLPAVAATAVLVAAPIVFALVTTAYSADKRARDSAAREELMARAQRVGRFGYWRYDPENERVLLSKRAEKVLGEAADQRRMSLFALLEITDLADREALHSALGSMLEGRSAHLEFRIVDRRGKERILWVEGRGRRDPDGRLVQVFGIWQDVTERKTMEAALRESEDHYRHAVELNPQIPWTADPQGNIAEVGLRWLELMGMERSEALGDGWARALHPDDVQATFATWSQCLVSGAPVDVEYRLRQANGSYRWFRACAAARRDARGDIVRWYGTLEDIHSQRRAVETLKASETFTRSILDSSTDCVKVLDLDGRLEFMNASGRCLNEIDDFDTVHLKPWDQLWPSESHEMVRAAIETARSGDVARFAAFGPTTVGTPNWWDVSISPIAGPDGRPARLLATSRDMTAAKIASDQLEQAQKEAEASAERLQQVLESTTDSVLILDRDERVSFANQRARKSLSKSRVLLGETIWDACPDVLGTPFEALFKAAAAERRRIDIDEFPARSGAWLEIHAYPFEDGFSIFFRDVTKRRQAKEEIRRRMEEAKAASRAKSDFLAVISHEIRTPMSGVLGLAEQLSLTETDADQRKLIDELCASGHTLLGIINDILDFSKIEAGKMPIEIGSADLRATFKEVEALFRSQAQTRGLAFSVEVDPALSTRHLTDADRLRQVLMNLVGNAIKFTDQGSVSVEVRCGPASGGRQVIEIDIADSGPGISKADLRRIFDPFEQADASSTRRHGGTGLGLAISKGFLNALGGKVVARSTPGQGSVFTVSLDLPIAPGEPAKPVFRTLETELPDVSGTRLLAAEDNRVNRMILSRLLERAGCKVAFATTGVEAVHRAKHEDFDLIFMDISMPEMDGYAATRAIRATEARSRAPAVPIVALSAHVGEHYRRLCLDSGMQTLLSKPFQGAAILQAIALHARPRTQPQGAAGPFSSDRTDASVAQPKEALPRPAVDLIGSVE